MSKDGSFLARALAHHARSNGAPPHTIDDFVRDAMNALPAVSRAAAKSPAAGPAAHRPIMLRVVHIAITPKHAEK